MAWCLWQSSGEKTKGESVLSYIYVTVLIGELLHRTAQSWPAGNSDPAVPLILLVLAAWSAWKGPSAAARVGAVLFWAVLGLYLAVFAAGIKDVRLSWLEPQWNAPDLLGISVLLIPCAGAELLKKRGGPGSVGWLSAAFLLVGAALTVGILSPKQACENTNAFYEMSRSLNLLGVARRFEALTCAGTTVGWFALLSLLLTLCGVYAQKTIPGAGKGGMWLSVTVAAAWKLCGLHIKPVFLLFTGAIFWVIVPLLTQGLGKIKKS